MAHIPFKEGDHVTADDPFNGRVEGMIMVINGTSVGIRSTAMLADHYVYYDYRSVTKND
ncbi:hypothetical protein [Arthrobacter sp. H5]|uniref:hypothetical protein n=1 Tax=Arthrobacter sp. H5 TaxID=1267973 RepID=UPI0004B84D9A|nr:hypothetical protein [Arthrobacter sp. H5]